MLACRDRDCAEAGATTGAAADEAIAVIDTTAIELGDETGPPLDCDHHRHHQHHPPHVVVLHHPQGSPDARVSAPSSRTRYLDRGRDKNVMILLREVSGVIR